jgi:hypothetical protein
VSLGLGILSVVLGLFAIKQAHFYKKEQDRQAKIQDAFLREQRINMAFSSIRTREIYEKMFKKGKIILRKDRAVIYATSAFRPDTVLKNLDEINELLREVLKNCYIEGVNSEIINRDIYQGDVIHEVNIRNECNEDYLKQILEVNKALEKYGLYLSVIFE